MMINVILLLYNHPIGPYAATLMDHVNAFERHSRFKVVKVNTELGFPPVLESLRFPVIVLHYSLFGKVPYKLDQRFYSYLERSESSYKVAFFQDEYRYCQQRFSFIIDHKIDCVYTRMAPRSFKDVYEKYTRVPRIISTLAGYVSDDLVKAGRRITKVDTEREIDVGYRARRLPYYLGRGGQDKHKIAEGFLSRATELGLKMDISFEETHRIYGRAWFKFLADCRSCLGVEGGASVVDLEGIVRSEYLKIIAANPNFSFQEFEEMAAGMLEEWEDRVPYRSITPRNSEAAAFRVCQILFEGKYSGIMEPMVHYIPLKKDFSNFDEVIRMFNDKALRRELTENAYRDLIASRRYSYETFIRSFDGVLAHAGVRPGSGSSSFSKAVWLLNSSQFYLKQKKLLANLTRPHRRRIRALIPLR